MGFLWPVLQLGGQKLGKVRIIDFLGIRLALARGFLKAALSHWTTMEALGGNRTEMLLLG